MASGTGSAKDTAVHSADKANVIKPEDIERLGEERKDQYLRRLAREQRANKTAFKRTEQWIEVQGNKVLRKFTNASGSAYTMYLFNKARYPEQWKQIEAAGGYDMIDSQTGKSVFLPVKIVNGKAFSKRGRN